MPEMTMIKRKCKNCGHEWSSNEIIPHADDKCANCGIDLFDGHNFNYFVVQKENAEWEEVKNKMQIIQKVKIRIRCPDCGKSEIFEPSKTMPAYWQHKCEQHNNETIDIEVMLE